ncbi:amidohydrolase family protein [Desulfospira joergensenii]|uniref:amidohydrolase family protein n=1 Tax=Desulfospira joergensenii TaxID=53329 RepID=UPI0003B7AC83|nr:amidohydrolase family protein [Desulfospira joergensenii]
MKKKQSSIAMIRETGAPKIHRAKWILVDPDRVIENGQVETAGGKILKTGPAGQGSGREPVTDHGSGVLMPVLVNTHLHLELSALKNRLPLGRGFQPWVRALLKEREALGPAGLAAGAAKAVREMESLGIGLVGEISTLGITRELLEKSLLGGVWFHEFLGTAPMESELENRERLSFSVAGHSPHTTAPDLLQDLKKAARDSGLPFSIHVAESEEEFRFIRGGAGEWKAFLESRGIDTRSWPLGSKSPVQYLDDLGLLDPWTLCVHLIRLETRDLDILARSGAHACICPRSNLNLHGRLPDIETMLAKNLAPALGTDSLASCDSLGIFDEMEFVKKHFPGTLPRDLLAMATINGARALGCEGFSGTLERGKQAAFIYVDLEARDKYELRERLTSNEF